MDIDILDLDWSDMLERMERQGIKDAYEVLDHCHASE